MSGSTEQLSAGRATYSTTIERSVNTNSGYSSLNKPHEASTDSLMLSYYWAAAVSWAAAVQSTAALLILFANKAIFRYLEGLAQMFLRNYLLLLVESVGSNVMMYRQG